MNKIKVIIIEDEVPVRKVLTFLLEAYPEMELVGVSGNVGQGARLIRNFHPDIVFLDVQLEDGTGFDILKRVSDMDFGVVFVTAHSEYAIRAIRCNALDYLLKPLDPEEFGKAVHRALDHRVGLDELHWEETPSRITVNTSEGRHLIPFPDLVRCQADGGYTLFHLNSGRKHVVSKPLKYFEELLPEGLFVRPHQSHLVNVAYVRSFTHKAMVLSDGSTQIPISLRKRSLVNRLLGN